jgi:ectoine hydroxylase-related dioxygenase (phytanoyl-CoA dioxygenase family)
VTDLASSVHDRIAANVRSVTADEIRFYRENGWVRLPALITRALAEELREHILAVAAERGDRTTHTPIESGYVTAERNGISGVNFRESDAFIGELATSHALGNVAADLIGTRPLRLWSDSVFGKPARGERHGTTWHQDYPSLPLDRAIGGQLWIAAVEITPDMGPLQYLSGSHREPPLGRGSMTPNGMVDVHPWLLEKYSVSPAFHLQPGDCMAHHSLTFHSAQPNTTDRDRIAWASHRFDARALYTGLVNDRSDGRGLVVGQPFDHPFFPIVTD